MDFSQLNMTVAGIHEGYRSGDFTPESLVDYLLEKAKAYSAHNIWITALTRSQLQPYLDKLAGKSPDELPLYGIPFAIKDNIDLAGIPTTAGCKDFTFTPVLWVLIRLARGVCLPCLIIWLA